MTFYDVYDVCRIMPFVIYDDYRLMKFVGYDVCCIMTFVGYDVCRFMMYTVQYVAYDVFQCVAYRVCRSAHIQYIQLYISSENIEHYGYLLAVLNADSILC